MADRQPILVTGGHRSGTAWVGRMLAASPEVGYIEEPFSLLRRRGVLDVPFPFWFPQISPANETPCIGRVSSMPAFRYQVGAELKTLRSPRDMGYMVRDWSWFARYRRRRVRSLLREPIDGFRMLYGSLDLPFGSPIEAFIAGHSEGSEPNAGISPFDVRRNNQETISVWRTRLSEDQIDPVRTGVEPIARDLYSGAEWERTLRFGAE
jgi:hypothetical protein